MRIITEGLPLNEPENRAIAQDLLWVLKAPPLMALETNWHPQQELGTPILEALTSDQWAHLRQARQGKLGAYFEALVCALVACSDHYSVVARSVVIQGEQRTLGELDVLVQHHSSHEIIHLELALKFYLQVPETSTGRTIWIGPGLRDFLHLKHQHLQNQQLTLPARARKAGIWPTQLPFPNRSMAWVTGRLFYPWSDQPNGLEPLIEPGHLYSHWLTVSAFERQKLPCQWLKKAQWLSGFRDSQVDQPTHGLPAQCLRKTPGALPNGEHERPCFIVPNDWPERARTSILQRFG